MHWGISRKVYCQLEDQCKACCFFGCYFCCLLEVSWLAAAVVAVEARDPGSVVVELLFFVFELLVSAELS